MKEDKQGNMGCRERNIGKRKCVSAVLLSVCLMFAAGCGGTNVQDGKDDRAGTQGAGEGAAEQQASEVPADARERKTETISFGEESEWESWTDYLYQSVKEETYAFAFLEAGSSQADFEWAYYDDREALTDAFLWEKDLREEASAKKAAAKEGADAGSEDLDEDGYLDMRILYPTHESGVMNSV